MMQFDFRSRPRQPRNLEPELRELIDRAVADGRVTVVPPGVSGLPGYEYDPQTRRVVMVDPEATQAAKARAAREAYEKARRAMNARRSEAAEQRYAEIGAAMDAGRTAEQIASERGETLLAVKAIIKKINRRRREAARGSDEGGAE